MAIRFDSAGERLNRAGPGSQSAWTLAGWFLIDVDANATQTLLGGLATDFSSAASLATSSNGTTPAISASTGSVAGTDVAVGTWFYLAATRSAAGTSRLWQGSRNDPELTEITPGANFPAFGSNWDLILANALGVANQLNGRAAYCRVWTTNLTQSQLEAEMRATSAVVTSGLWADYPFSANANDASGNSRNWTVTGTVSYVSQPPLDIEPEVGVWDDISPYAPDPDDPTPGANFGFQSVAVGSTGTLYVTGDYEGLYRSTDHGDTLTHYSADGDLESGTPWNYKIAPDGTHWSNAGYGVGGPLESTDGGQNWTKRAAGSPTAADDVYCIAIDPNDSDHILLAWHTDWSGDSSSGVSETTNGGTSWTNIPAPTDDWGTGHAIFFTPGGAWLLVTQDEGQGVWRTEDGGDNWTEVRVAAMTHGATQCLTVIGTTLILALRNEIVVSTDDGETWSDMTTGLNTGVLYSTVATDGTNLFTAPSFPVAGSYGTFAWYTRPLASGPWVEMLQSPDTLVNGPRQWAYDSNGGYLYAVNYHGGVWRFTPTAADQAVDVDPCALTLTGVQPTIAASSAAARTLDVGAFTLTGVQPTLAGVGATARTLDVAAFTLTGVTPTLAGSSAITATVDTCAITLAPLDVTLAPSSAASQTVDVAALTLAPVDPVLTASGAASATVDPCALTLAGVDVTAASGATVIDVDPCALTLVPVDTTLTASSAATIAVDPCALTLTCVEIATGGVALIDVDPCSLTLTPVGPTLAGTGNVAEALDPCELAIAGVTPTLTPTGSISATIDPGLLTLDGITPTLAASSAASITLDPATLTLTCATVDAYAGPLVQAIITLPARRERSTARTRREPAVTAHREHTRARPRRETP